MKNLIVFFLLFSFVTAFPQAKELTKEIEAAFKNKNPGAKLSYWRVENDLYYLEFNIRVALSDKDKFTVIQCDNKGDNIKIKEDNL